MAQVELSEAQSVECWEQILARRQELSERLGQPVALKTAMVDVLASSNYLRVPILVEYEELKKLQINAATDAITGLYNRRLFDEYFEKELERAKRYGHPLALLMLDLHRFKEVNDRYGHMVGDQVLQAAASTLRKTMRTSDYAFRIGGDEFALLLPHSDAEQASTLGRRLCANYLAAVEAMNVEVTVAFDFGVALYPEDGDLMVTLIQEADKRLYKQKNSVGDEPRDDREPLRAEVPAPAEPARAEVSAPPPVAPLATGLPRVIAMGNLPLREAAAGPVAVAQIPPAISPSGADKRKWERVSLAGTRAHAVMEGSGQKTPVLDLSYGGVALQVEQPEELPKQFQATLHVPILPSVKVSLRKTYVGSGGNGHARVGCAFIP